MDKENKSHFKVININDKDKVMELISDCLNKKGFIYIDENFNGTYVEPSQMYKFGDADDNILEKFLNSISIKIYENFK